MAQQDDTLRTLVAEVAAAYFSNSHVTATDIPTVIAHIAQSLQNVGQEAVESAPAEAAPEEPKKLTRAQIQKSITPDALISFEDGRSYKTLRRHLSVRGLSPEQYRQKWGLPGDYPMTAPSYSEQRKALAQKIGLGRKTAPAPRAAKPAGSPRRTARTQPA
jgi:predicted transcriptional regulator